MNSNTKTLAWSKNTSETSPHRPTSREGHNFLYMPDKNKYLLFAGVSHQRLSDIFTLDAEPYFYIHGGKNKTSASADTYFLDTDKWIWKKVFTMEQPSARYMHSVAKNENKEAYIFGGFDEKRNKCLGDIHKYDYSKKYFLKITENLKITSIENDRIAGSSWNKLTDSGNIPKPRKGHTMLFYKNKLILFGGMTDKGLEDGNLYEFNIETRIWKILEISGIHPIPRIYFSMNFINENEIFIFGGKIKKGEFEGDFEVSNEYLQINLQSLNISAPFIANVCPSARFGHSSAYNSNKEPMQHIILGGLDQTYCSFDIYMISQVDMGSDKKWVYEQKKMHSNQSVSYEIKDDIYETAKKTIINYKKQIEQLASQLVEVNRR